MDKQRISPLIHRVMDNLTTIKDDGEFYIYKEGKIIDDKSWNVWNWPQGIGLYGLYRYWKYSQDHNALQIIQEWFHCQMEQGAPKKNVNTMAPLLSLAYLYEETKDSRYLPYLENWAEWVMYEMPRTKENGLQHMTYGKPKTGQIWDDTLMMTVLPLAKIGKLLGRSAYIEESKRQFLLHAKYLVDKQTGLWFHGWTFEGDHNFSEALWGRGNCWITIAIPELIDVLELPKSDGFREFLGETLQRQIQTLGRFQSETGLWHTLIDDEASYLEASATAGFAYGILKSVNKGYIDEKYREVGIRAIEGLLPEISEAGAVGKVSVGTGIGATLDHYKQIRMTEMPYGQSLVILALTEFLYGGSRP